MLTMVSDLKELYNETKQDPCYDFYFLDLFYNKNRSEIAGQMCDQTRTTLPEARRT